MKILVTGGAGFIGSHLIEALLKREDFVICLDNFDPYYDPEYKWSNIKPFLKNKGFKLYKTDIRDLKELDKIFQRERPEKVVHIAAKVGVRPSLADPFLYQEVNVRGTLNLLELARKYNIKNFIFASSSSVYGENKKIPFAEDDRTDQPISPYGATKKAGEILCYTWHRLYNLNITCLRFFTVYGPRGRPDMAPYKFTKIIFEEKELPVFGKGDSKRDYTYIDDIIQGLLTALDKNFSFEIINLGNSHPISLKEFISLIERLTGKKAKIKKLPMQPGDMPLTYADITKAKRLLGYQPKVNIEEGMTKFIEWYKRNRLKV